MVKLFLYTNLEANMKSSLQNINPKNPEKLPTVQKLWHLKPKLRFLQWLRVLWKVVKDLFFKDIWPQVNLYEVYINIYSLVQFVLMKTPLNALITLFMFFFRKKSQKSLV